MIEGAMIEGTCHCGAVTWRFAGVPESATACNCTLCRRHGALWAYGHENEGIEVSGPSRVYSWGDAVNGFHFCGDCGCLAYWRWLNPGEDGRRRIGVNLRLAAPDAVGPIAVEHLDGFDTWTDVSRATRCVADMWF